MLMRISAANKQVVILFGALTRHSGTCLVLNRMGMRCQYGILVSLRLRRVHNAGAAAVSG